MYNGFKKRKYQKMSYVCINCKQIQTGLEIRLEPFSGL